MSLNINKITITEAFFVNIGLQKLFLPVQKSRGFQFEDTSTDKAVN